MEQGLEVKKNMEQGLEENMELGLEVRKYGHGLEVRKYGTRFRNKKISN